MIDKYYYFKTIVIAITLIMIIFCLVGCEKNSENNQTERYKTMTPLEKCIDICPEYSKCMDKCFDYNYTIEGNNK